jgi:integrase
MANVKADALRTSIVALIQQVRSARSSPALGDYLRSLFDSEIDTFKSELRADEQARRAALFAGHSGSPDGEAPRAQMNLAISNALGLALLSDDPLERRAASVWAADAYFRSVLGRSPERESPEYQEVLDECTTVLVDALVTQRDLKAGSAPTRPFSGALAPDARAKAAADAGATSHGKMRLGAYFEKVYVPTLNQGKAATGERTLSGKKLAVKLFMEIIGDKTIHSISAEDMWVFHNELLKLPDRRGLKAAERSLGSTTLIQRAESGAIVASLLHPKTVNKHLSGIKSILDLAAKRTHVKASVAAGVRADVDREEETGRAFTTDELNRIFKLPLFTGCSEGLSAKGLLKPGPILIQDDRFWIPLLLFFTGARSSEIVGLEPDDVEPDHVVPHILIRGNETRRLKNHFSKRMVPIHPLLVEIGFLEFAREQRRTQTRRFFPLAEQLRYRDGSTNELQNKALSNSLIMRQFNRTLLPLAGVSKDGGTVKCFRNTFEQEALAKIPSDEVRRRLTGRRVDSTVVIYTQNIPNDPIKRDDLLDLLSASMKLLIFRGVDLSHIHKARAARAATA